MGLKKTTGTARARVSQNLFLNIATLCPACWPWLWTRCSSSCRGPCHAACAPWRWWPLSLLVRVVHLLAADGLAAVPVFHDARS